MTGSCATIKHRCVTHLYGCFAIQQLNQNFTMRNKRNLYKLSSLVFLFSFLSAQSIAQTSADSLLDFIVKNKSRSSLCLSKNDTIIAKYNEDTPMPLAGTVYIMTAVEFAKQAGAGIFDENSYVALSDVNKYYIPVTDSTSYQAWLTDERSKNHIVNDSIQLINIARGMLTYNCNANAEYLVDILGPDNLKNNIELFRLTKHGAIFPMVSSMFMYQNPKKLKERKILDGISSLTEEQYCKLAFEIHKALEYDTLLKPKFSGKQFDIKMQQLWSSRLTPGTTKEYVQICKILNNRRFMNTNSYGILAEILETAMEDTSKLTWLKHEGMKDGRTPWVLTKALYATTSDGTKIELAYFFNQLTPDENKRLSSWMDSFENNILTSESFRQKVTTSLN